MKNVASFDHKFSAILAFGLLLQTLGIYGRLLYDCKHLRLATRVVPPAVTSYLVWNCLHQNVFFSAFTGTVFIFIYSFLYPYVLKRLPRSFTLGEAAIVAQAVVIFLASTFTYLPVAYNTLQAVSEMDQIKPVLQVGLIHVLLIIFMLDMFPMLRNAGGAYPLLIYVVAFVAMLPSPASHTPQIVVLFDLLTKDPDRIYTILGYAGLFSAAIGTVCFFVFRGSATSTRVRKIFHVLIICVFIPGLIYQCTLLFAASVLAFAGFIVLETLRLIQLPPFHAALQRAVETFVDEQDSGAVAFTPIYLLAGCALPIWIHPAPCDPTDSAGLDLVQLLAGILSVGFGDMAASVVGSKFGRTKWPGGGTRKKSVEGTVANVLVQVAVVGVLYLGKFIALSPTRTAIIGAAILVNSLVEAFTDQVDNLVLPLVTFSILALL